MSNDKTKEQEKKPKKPAQKKQKKEGAEEQKDKVSDEVSEELVSLKQQNQELNDRLLRMRADFDNFRKRTIKEREDIARRSNENLISELIPVIDHFEMGLITAKESEINDSVYDGFKLVYDQLCQALAKVGVVRIDAEGDVFNPHLHECISHLPSDEVPEGVVTAQTRCGYQLGNYMLRAAQVVVSSGAQQDANEKDSE